MTTLLLTLALLCGQFDDELAIAIAINAPQPAQQSVVTEPELQPEVPDLTPEPEFITRTVQKSRKVMKPKYCGRGKICGWYEATEYYTETEKVPASSVSADAYATPLDAGGRILEYLRPSSPQTFLDLGSGDGRMVVSWAVRFGYPAIGIESDPKRVALARNFARIKGVSHLVTIIEGDFTKMDWPAADVIYIYQFPDVLSEVSGRLKNADRVVSFAHSIPGLSMIEHGDFYSWQKQKPIVQHPVAFWDGRAYTGPLCNKANCAMCNSIRSQLAAQR